MSNGQVGDRFEEEEIYYCTKTKFFPVNDVVKAIMSYYYENEKPEFRGLYNFLRHKYHISSFNRNNLIELLKIYFDISKTGDLTLIGEPVIESEMPQKDSDEFFLKLYSVISHLFEEGYFLDIRSVDIRTYLDTLVSANNAINTNGMVVEVDKYEKLEISISSYIDVSTIEDPDQKMDSFIEKCRIRQKQYSKLIIIKKTLDNIHRKNLDLRIQYLVSTRTNELLLELGVETLRDLVKKWSFITFDCISGELPYFSKVLNLLSVEYSKVAQDLFLGMITKESQNDRTLAVLTQRSKKVTLESLGNSYGIQRERIRQIEAKALRKFESGLKTKDGKVLLGIIASKCKNVFTVSYGEIEEIFGSLKDAFIFGMNHTMVPDFIRYPDIELFNMTTVDWFTQVEGIIVELDSTLSESQVKRHVTEIVRELNVTGIKVDSSHLYRIFELNYRKQGSLYSRSMMNLYERYSHIVKNHFQNGIYIYHDDDIKKLKDIYVREFKDESVVDKTTRTIGSVLGRNLSLVDRGKYNLKEKIPSLTKELADEIETYLESSGTVILFTSIYGQFKRKLKPLGINNRYMLQSLIRSYFGDKFYYRKDALSKDVNNFSISGEIEAYIDTLPSFFTIDQIDRKFPSVMSGLASRILYTDPKYIAAFNKKWISGENISITEEERSGLVSIIKDLLKNKTFITTKDVLESTRLKYPGFYSKNRIDNRFYLFGILKYLFQDEFEFARPYISNEEIEVGSREERARSYMSDYDLVTIDELKEALDMMDIRLTSLSQFISDISDQFLRVDESTLVSKTSLQITDENISSVDDILGLILKDKIGINTKNVNLTFFPKFKQPFNKYFLASFVESFSTRFKIIKTTNFYNTAEYIIVKSDLKVENYEQYIKLLNKEAK